MMEGRYSVSTITVLTIDKVMLIRTALFKVKWLVPTKMFNGTIY